jgi:hypothetical protein
MTAPEEQPERLITPDKLPPFEGKLELRCQSCGAIGRYAVGRILLDPAYRDAGAPGTVPLERFVGFTGYFHCRLCGAGGPWKFTAGTQVQFLVLLAEAVRNPQHPHLHLLQMRMFDGTVVHTATEGEAYLRKLIDANPTDYFLWSRLGNLYEHGDRMDLAIPAFTRAVELNPKDVESHYSLGALLMENGQAREAAEHFHQVLRHCRTAPPSRQAGLLQEMVRDTLERLFELHTQSKGAIAFLPPFERPDGIETRPEDAGLVELDLDTEEAWETLVATFLTGKVPDARARSSPLPLPLPRPPQPLASGRVGRNDPCPCGSGKKFKHCCGKKR